MKAFVFKITAQIKEEVTREIQIPAQFTFEDFHYSILDAFDLSTGEMASFYTSDATYIKGIEITLFDMDVQEDEAVNLLMSDTPLDKIIQEDITHFVYHYDFLFLKIFHIELIHTLSQSPNEEVLLLNTVGFYPKTSEQMADFLLDEDLNFDQDGEGLFDEMEEPGKRREKFVDFNEDFGELGDDEYTDGSEFDNIDDYDDL